jgi:hypothetical protein
MSIIVLRADFMGSLYLPFWLLHRIVAQLDGLFTMAAIWWTICGLFWGHGYVQKL